MSNEDINREIEVASKYNEAAAQILRLSNLWQQNHKAFLNGYPKEMYFIMTRIWAELYADAIRLNRQKYVGEFHELEKEVNLAINKKDRIKLFASCRKMELWLKDLQTSVGKGSAYKEDSRRMF